MILYKVVRLFVMKFIYIQLFVIFCIFTGGCQRGALKGNYSLSVQIEIHGINFSCSIKGRMIVFG